MNSSLGGRSKCATEDIGISTRDKRQMTPNIGSTPRHISRQLALQLALFFIKRDVTYGLTYTPRAFNKNCIRETNVTRAQT